METIRSKSFNNMLEQVYPYQQRRFSPLPSISNNPQVPESPPKYKHQWDNDGRMVYGSSCRKLWRKRNSLFEDYVGWNEGSNHNNMRKVGLNQGKRNLDFKFRVLVDPEVYMMSPICLGMMIKGYVKERSKHHC
jgi:hypothetical protein